jgi:hypothetical protein
MNRLSNEFERLFTGAVDLARYESERKTSDSTRAGIALQERRDKFLEWVVANGGDILAALKQVPEESASRSTDPTVNALAVLYEKYPCDVAYICDRMLDKSGALLGEVRNARNRPQKNILSKGDK